MVKTPHASSSGASIPGANTLFYGDNLRIMRDHIPSNSVDLVYLDPPFNSNATYNVLFKSPDGASSQAQIEAFDDTWHWNDTAEIAFDEAVNNAYGNADVGNMLIAMQGFLGKNDLMAYLAMMAVRLLELHRVLKDTGSLYLHCDPTASHYLKILLDAVFGPTNYRSEIIWKRQSAHNDATTKFGSVADKIFFYVKSKNTKFYPVRMDLDPQYITKFYRHQNSEGRFYRLSDMSAPEGGGMAAINKSTGKPNGWFEWKGYQPPSRGWRYSPETMEKLDNQGKIHYPSDKSKRLQLKRYLDENEGQMVGNVWDDIQPLHGASREALGYPTQKPLALLERIISASSNPGDLVLDPFCGCGTTVHAAQKLGRRWLGIDITHLAIGLIRRRLIDAFPQALFDTVGVPKDLDGARDLAARDKHQFQLWALSLLDNAQPWKGGKKGGDGGIDGYMFFKPDGKTTERAVVSVKGGANIKPSEVRDLVGTVEKERARMGIFVTLEDPTVRMRQEASAAGLYKTEYGTYAKVQILTIEELLEGKKPHMPWIDQSVFKKAKREKTEVQDKLDI